MCEDYEKLSSRLKVINKSNELFVDTYCHTMLADREVILSHMTSHDRLCLSRKHVQSVRLFIEMVDITTEHTTQSPI